MTTILTQLTTTYVVCQPYKESEMCLYIYTNIAAKKAAKGTLFFGLLTWPWHGSSNSRGIEVHFIVAEQLVHLSCNPEKKKVGKSNSK